MQHPKSAAKSSKHPCANSRWRCLSRILELLHLCWILWKRKFRPTPPSNFTRLKNRLKLEVLGKDENVKGVAGTRMYRVLLWGNLGYGIRGDNTHKGKGIHQWRTARI